MIQLSIKTDLLLLLMGLVMEAWADTPWGSKRLSHTRPSTKKLV